MKAMPNMNACIMYDGSRDGDHLFCARAGVLGVNTYRWNERREDKCFMCNVDEKETVEHLLMECGAYEREQQSMMEVILNEINKEGYGMREQAKSRWQIGNDCGSV